MTYFYPNYSSYMPQQQSPCMTTQPQQLMPQTPSALQGKIVDSEEIVKATEVPFGGYGVFPKADLSEIYIKTWNNNGTTQINVYRPIATEVKEDLNNVLLERMKSIEEKIDAMSNISQSAEIASEKKELKANVY